MGEEVVRDGGRGVGMEEGRVTCMVGGFWVKSSIDHQ